MKTLKLKASGRHLIANIDALRAGSLRYVGRVLNRATLAFESTDKEEVINTDEVAYYITAVRSGDLLPADAATAALCGVSFSSK